jgi:hypothetical protein
MAGVWSLLMYQTAARGTRRDSSATSVLFFPLTLIDQFNQQEIRRAFQRVFTVIIGALPGEPWARTAEMKERFRIDG